MNRKEEKYLNKVMKEYEKKEFTDFDKLKQLDKKAKRFSNIFAYIFATISFLEIAFAIRGLCLSRKKGHYYRDLKLINLCSALTALVLTAIAFSSFASNGKMNIFNAILGGVVGIIMQLIGFALMIPAYPMFVKYSKEYKEKYKDEIISLSEELLNSSEEE